MINPTEIEILTKIGNALSGLDGRDQYLIVLTLLAAALTSLSKKDAKLACEILDELPEKVRSFPGFVCYAGSVKS